MPLNTGEIRRFDTEAQAVRELDQRIRNAIQAGTSLEDAAVAELRDERERLADTFHEALISILNTVGDHVSDEELFGAHERYADVWGQPMYASSISSSAPVQSDISTSIELECA